MKLNYCSPHSVLPTKAPPLCSLLRSTYCSGLKPWFDGGHRMIVSREAHKFSQSVDRRKGNDEGYEQTPNSHSCRREWGNHSESTIEVACLFLGSTCCTSSWIRLPSVTLRLKRVVNRGSWGNHCGLAWHWAGRGRGVGIRENLLGEELVEPRLGG